MKKTLAILFSLIIATVALSGCGTSTHQEIKDIGGVKSVCSWTEPGFNPMGKKNDYICQGMAVQVPVETSNP